MGQYIILAITAALTGWLFDTLNVPVGWMLGPMVAGAVVSSLMKRSEPLPQPVMRTGQALIGLGIGVDFTLATLKQVALLGVPLVTAVVITGALSILNGYLLCRWAGVDPATGFVGTLPGAASAMVVMAEELGADPVGVTILTYVRMVLVVLLSPLAVSIFFPGGGTGAGGAAAAAAASAVPAAPWALDVAVLLACGILGPVAGKRLHLPSSSFLGAALAIMLVSWMVPYQFAVPQPLFNLGMLMVGLSVGMRFHLASVVRLGKAVLLEVFLVVGLIALCLGVGYFIHLVTGIDPMTAALGSAPGGMDMMTATAAEMGGDAGVVLAMQMTRWLMVLLLGPWVATRLGRRQAAAADD